VLTLRDARKRFVFRRVVLRGAIDISRRSLIVRDLLPNVERTIFIRHVDMTWIVISNADLMLTSTSHFSDDLFLMTINGIIV
jgi:hypothetical protein